MDSWHQVYLLRSHSNNISTAKNVLFIQFFEVNIPTCKQIRLMKIKSSSTENIECTERD